MNKEQLLKTAVESLASEFPNSIVADLLVHFPHAVVFKLIEIYSGRTLRIPRTESVWRSYRNKVIYDALTAENILAVRRQLSEFFGISPNHVRSIYTYEKNRKMRTLKKRSTERSAKLVYKGRMGKFFEEITEVISRK